MEEQILKKMHELETRIDYKFNDISWLSKAMRSQEIDRGSCKKRRFSNDTLAVVGDAALKTVWADRLYFTTERSGDLTEEKKAFESNATFYKIVEGENLRIYTYNDSGFDTAEHKVLKSKEAKHDPYIEAIAGAIYYDGGFDQAKAWCEQWLLPLVEKYTERPE